jgi:DNA helicase-2/ATP-dependent DNA helicase PcrA
LDLTPDQWSAVDHQSGPLLVLAGPGSGKTRVITRRIARLVEKGIPPRRILAITFTNKAANEMAGRVEQLMPGTRIWVSTFHRFCARLLREWARGVGLKPQFTIYDTTDQQQLIRDVLNELNIDPVHFSPARIASRISNLKNDLVKAEAYAQQFEDSIGNHWEAVLAKAYPRYQARLLEANAVDFDDLLLHVVTLLTENPELRADLDARHEYIMVDEYQDTNMAQYQIVRALSRDFPNLCVTGDPDQSIYGWRGARIDNILRFESDYPKAAVVRLEQNYRSTKEILKVADSLISHNVYRKAKALVTDNPDGEPAELMSFDDGPHEADVIALEIRELVNSGQRQWSDFAIFYRVNALSRELEQALRRHRVPYQVAAGVAFYERAEIKDVLAYLQLIHNPDDYVAFKRVVNKPARGIGKTTQQKLMTWAGSQGLTLLEAAGKARECPQLSKRAVLALEKFARMMAELTRSDGGSVGQLMKTVLDRSQYTAGWADSDSEDDQQRKANVEELETAAHQYDEAEGSDATLEGFLELTSLVNDVDALEESAGQVTLMTLHAAKGLEFPVVYIVAVENNLIPHERSMKNGDPRELEEERRLLFVGVTRAEERLCLTQTRARAFRGRLLPTIASPFLREMPLKDRDFRIEVFDYHGYHEEKRTNERRSASAIESDEAGDDSFDVVRFEEPSDQTPSASKPAFPRLMTGADLLSGGGKAVDLPQGFQMGQAVRHPRYGLGVVVEIGGFGRRRTVTVEFQKDGRTETFVAAKCPLQPVNSP